jgi:hypothetical protein
LCYSTSVRRSERKRREGGDLLDNHMQGNGSLTVTPNSWPLRATAMERDREPVSMSVMPSHLWHNCISCPRSAQPGSATARRSTCSRRRRLHLGECSRPHCFAGCCAVWYARPSPLLDDQRPRRARSAPPFCLSLVCRRYLRSTALCAFSSAAASLNPNLVWSQKFDPTDTKRFLLSDSCIAGL